MGVHEDQARAVAQAVLTAKPADPVAPDIASPENYIERELRPFREFMSDLASSLRDSRAHAAISEAQIDNNVHQLRDERYVIINNSGESHNLGFRFVFHNPGFMPRLIITGMDAEANDEFDALVIPKNGVVITYQFEAVMPVLARFLTRFLSA